MLVEPTLEARRVFIDIVVNHQADGERRAVVRRIERIVGANVDGREDVILHAGIGLDAVLVILEMFHTRVEHIVLAQLFGGRARRCQQQSSHRCQ